MRPEFDLSRDAWPSDCDLVTEGPALLLSDRVRAGTHRRGFDLNEDKLVDQTDRQIWVHDLKGTYLGEAKDR
jgi:hypothetical protein